MTFRATFIVTTQVLLRVESQFIQLRKVDPPVGCAVSVTVAPTTKLALQVYCGTGYSRGRAGNCSRRPKRCARDGDRQIR